MKMLIGFMLSIVFLAIAVAAKSKRY